MSFGKPYIMRTSGFIHDGWLLLRPKMANINNDYLHAIIGSKLIYSLFKRSTIGGVVENLNIDLVKNIKVPVPPIEKQKEISDHITAIRNQAKQLQQEAKAVLEKAKQEVEAMILGESEP
jgi:restriction endonuclease S subunit